jgi:hypothetical protein
MIFKRVNKRKWLWSFDSRSLLQWMIGPEGDIQISPHFILEVFSCSYVRFMNEEVFKHSMLDVTWNHSRGPPIGGFDGDDTRLASGEEVSGAQSMKTWAVVVEVRTQLWKLVEQDPLLLLLLLSCSCGWGTYYLHSPLGGWELRGSSIHESQSMMNLNTRSHLMHHVHETNALSHDVKSIYTRLQE